MSERGEEQGKVNEQVLELEGKILQLAKVKALGKVQASPTAENLKNYQAAERALAEFLRRQAAAADPGGEVFPRVADVHRYLESCGISITRQTVDNHVKAGKLGEHPGGGFLRSAVDRYVETFLLSGDDGQAELMREKVEAEVKKIKAQAEHWRTRARRERGELIEVSAVERALSERAAFLRADLENFFRSQAAAIIDRVRGDHDLTGELVDWGLELVEEWLDRYTRPMEQLKEGTAE